MSWEKRQLYGWESINKFSPRKNQRYAFYQEGGVPDAMTLIDFMAIPPDHEEFTSYPEDAQLKINRDMLDAMLSELSSIGALKPYVAGDVYQKDMADRHLDIVEKLIDKLPRGGDEG